MESYNAVFNDYSGLYEKEEEPIDYNDLLIKIKDSDDITIELYNELLEIPDNNIDISMEAIELIVTTDKYFSFVQLDQKHQTGIIIKLINDLNSVSIEKIKKDRIKQEILNYYLEYPELFNNTNWNLPYLSILAIQNNFEELFDIIIKYNKYFLGFIKIVAPNHRYRIHDKYLFEVSYEAKIIDYYKNFFDELLNTFTNYKENKENFQIFSNKYRGIISELLESKYRKNREETIKIIKELDDKLFDSIFNKTENKIILISLKNKDIEFTNYLLDRGVELNKKDENHFSILRLALLSKNIELIEKIYSMFLKSIGLKDKSNIMKYITRSAFYILENKQDKVDYDMILKDLEKSFMVRDITSLDTYLLYILSKHRDTSAIYGGAAINKYLESTGYKTLNDYDVISLTPIELLKDILKNNVDFFMESKKLQKYNEKNLHIQTVYKIQVLWDNDLKQPIFIKDYPELKDKKLSLDSLKQIDSLKASNIIIYPIMDITEILECVPYYTFDGINYVTPDYLKKEIYKEFVTKSGLLYRIPKLLYRLELLENLQNKEISSNPNYPFNTLQPRFIDQSFLCPKVISVKEELQPSIMIKSKFSKKTKLPTFDTDLLTNDISYFKMKISQSNIGTLMGDIILNFNKYEPFLECRFKYINNLDDIKKYYIYKDSTIDFYYKNSLIYSIVNTKIGEIYYIGEYEYVYKIQYPEIIKSILNVINQSRAKDRAKIEYKHLDVLRKLVENYRYEVGGYIDINEKGKFERATFYTGPTDYTVKIPSYEINYHTHPKRLELLPEKKMNNSKPFTFSRFNKINFDPPSNNDILLAMKSSFNRYWNLRAKEYLTTFKTLPNGQPLFNLAKESGKVSRDVNMVIASDGIYVYEVSPSMYTIFEMSGLNLDSYNNFIKFIEYVNIELNNIAVSLMYDKMTVDEYKYKLKEYFINVDYYPWDKLKKEDGLTLNINIYHTESIVKSTFNYRIGTEVYIRSTVNYGIIYESLAGDKYKIAQYSLDMLKIVDDKIVNAYNILKYSDNPLDIDKIIEKCKSLREYSKYITLNFKGFVEVNSSDIQPIESNSLYLITKELNMPDLPSKKDRVESNDNSNVESVLYSS